MTNNRIDKSAIFKFLGLIAFFVIMAVVVAFIWPYISGLFEPGGVEDLLSDVRDAGIVGVFILLGLQFLQIVIAFIPGEITQIAAGMLYGPWLGALVILIGCIISSAFVFVLVHRLGAPFVQGMVPMKFSKKFEEFERTKKLNIIVFILFLIPGLPKDTFTYLVPLTNMRMRDFLILSNSGRIPGILLSTYAAGSLVDGNYVVAIVVFVLAASLGILGIVFNEKIMNVIHKIKKHDDTEDGSDSAGASEAKGEKEDCHE